MAGLKKYVGEVRESIADIVFEECPEVSGFIGIRPYQSLLNKRIQNFLDKVEEEFDDMLGDMDQLFMDSEMGNVPEHVREQIRDLEKRLIEITEMFY